jgi:glycosyltransferase involved in cell wall biosynthesis
VPALRDDTSPLTEIIFVDDGSTDKTAGIVSEFPVRCLPGNGRGPGAARNIGWRVAKGTLVWFVDADCVAEPDALPRLLPHLRDPSVGGVGGSYGTMTADNLLSCLIHEEIVERHRVMGSRVNFLATFNVIYRRNVLDQIGGFDERFLKAQDAELAFRAMDAGYELRFEFESRVRHFHPTRWTSYLRTQRQQGYWRVWLHLSHHGHATGDSYSSLGDHLQPPLAMLTLFAVVAAGVGHAIGRPEAWWPALGLAAILAALQWPMTLRLLLRTRRGRYLCYAVMGFFRAMWRGMGMTQGLVGYLLRMKRTA